MIIGCSEKKITFLFHYINCSDWKPTTPKGGHCRAVFSPQINKKASKYLSHLKYFWWMRFLYIGLEGFNLHIIFYILERPAAHPGCFKGWLNSVMLISWHIPHFYHVKMIWRYGITHIHPSPFINFLFKYFYFFHYNFLIHLASLFMFLFLNLFKS